jgi:hypothetical protein
MQPGEDYTLIYTSGSLKGSAPHKGAVDLSANEVLCNLQNGDNRKSHKARAPAKSAVSTTNKPAKTR